MIFELTNFIITALGTILAVSGKKFIKNKKVANIVFYFLIIITLIGVFSRILSGEKSEEKVLNIYMSNNDDIIFTNDSKNIHVNRDVNNDSNIEDGYFDISLKYNSNILIEEGDDIEYTLLYPKEQNIKTVTLNKNDIILHGFNANIDIIDDGAYSKFIRLKNVVKTPDYNTSAYIEIMNNSAVDYNNNKAKGILESDKFVFRNFESGSVPSISISVPNKNNVILGDSVEFRITIVNADIVSILPSDIGIAGNGVTLDKTVYKSEDEDEVWIVKLSNIQGDIDKIFSIAIRMGVAANAFGYNFQTPKSYGCKIIETDFTRPTMTISDPSVTSVKEGENIQFIITYADNHHIEKILLNESFIILYGFTAHLEINNGINSNNERIVHLSNIKKTDKYENGAYIEIKADSAYDYNSNMALGIPRSDMFIIN